MFKSKKWLSLLIPLTLIIWSIIGYQIYSGLNPELPAIEEAVFPRFRESEKEIDLMELNLPSYDPFLGNVYVKKKISKKKKKSNTNDLNKIIWPKVIYKGMVKNKNSKQKVVAIEINQKNRLVSPGQEVDSVTLLNAYPNYITLKYKNKSKRFENK